MQPVLFHIEDFPRKAPPTPEPLPRIPHYDPEDGFDALFEHCPGPDYEDVLLERKARRWALRICQGRGRWDDYPTVRDAILDFLTRKPRTHRAEPTDYGCRFVRKVKGRKYQGRFPLPASQGGTINLGLWDTPKEAREAVKKWVEAGNSPVKGLPPGVLPKYARRRDDGKFDAAVRKNGTLIVLGPFGSAEDAFFAMHREICRRFGYARVRQPN